MGYTAGNKKSTASHDRVAVLLLSQWLMSDYLALMLMVLGLIASALGRVMVRMPFSKSALDLSVCTSAGRVIERSNEP